MTDKVSILQNMLSQSEWNNLLSGGLGAFFGAAASILAAYLTIKSEEKRKKEEEHKNFINIICAINSEFKVVYSIYNKVIGSLIDSGYEKIDLETKIRISNNYFPIYQKSADIIGIIKNKNYQCNIIKAYSFACSQIEMIGILDKMVSDLQDVYHIDDAVKIMSFSTAKRIEIREQWRLISENHGELEAIFKLAHQSMEKIMSI